MPVFSSLRSLRSRILMALVGLVTVAIAVVLLIQSTRQEAVLLKIEKNHGMAIARSLAAATATPLLTYNHVSLEQLAERAVEEEGVEYVVVLNKEGVVAAYRGHPGQHGTILDDAISQKAFASETLLIQELAGLYPGHKSCLDIAVPVFVEGSPQKWGMVRVGLSLEHIYVELNRTRAWIVGSGLVVLAITILVARLLTRRITGPLDRLVEATGELAKGNFDYRIGITTADEIGGLSRKFDDMSAIIREKQSEVERTNLELATLNAGLEEKVAERARELAEAEKKYRLLFEQSPNPICIIQDGLIRFYNQALCNTFGFTSEELSARDWGFLELLDTELHDDIRRALQSPEDDTEARVFSREIIGRHKDDSVIHLEMRGIWIYYEGSPALEIILVDVTERKQIQDQFVSSERLRALGEMAGGVAHDFNNVLGAILGRAQLLQRRDLSEEVQRGLHIIEKAAMDGSATVQRIQEFSRVRTDQEFSAVDLISVLEDVVEMTRSRWEDDAHKSGKIVRIERHLEAVPRVDGSISELRELFMNFVLNAVDAIQDEGSVNVLTRTRQGRVEVEISDTGHGMSSEVQGKLFDPFFTTKGANGVGLGMSIAYGTIQRHGGEVKVASEVGMGTTFRISFPVSQSPEQTKEETSEITDSGAGCILVVDDEDEIRDLVQDVLLEGGYEVHTVCSGAEALERLGEMDFDLVITDLGMPGMSGWDVARGCREISPDTSIALLTGWGATVDTANAERVGVDRIMKKPFEMMDLLGMARDLVAKRGLKDTA